MFNKKNRDSLLMFENFKIRTDKDLEIRINESKKILKEFYEMAVGNDTEGVKSKLKQKPDLISYKIPLAKFKTIFHMAALNNNFDFFKYLYQIEPKGVNYETDKWCLTPLHFVAFTNNLEFFKQLILWGADINHIDKKGWSVLYGSIAFSKSYMTEYILSQNVNVNIMSEIGRTPLIKSSTLISFPVQEKKD